MKKISISKTTWKKLHKIKNVKGLGSFSKTVDYLITFYYLKGENSQKLKGSDSGEKTPYNLQEKPDILEIGKHVDMLIKVKNFKDWASR